MTFIKILGWLGVIIYLLAYFLLVIKKIKSDQDLYHVLNILGAVGLLLNAWVSKDYPSLVINIIWGLIAVFAIVFVTGKSGSNVK